MVSKEEFEKLQSEVVNNSNKMESNLGQFMHYALGDNTVN